MREGACGPSLVDVDIGLVQVEGSLDGEDYGVRVRRALEVVDHRAHARERRFSFVVNLRGYRSIAIAISSSAVEARKAMGVQLA